MQISLSPDGPPFWYLQEGTTNIGVTLVSPGPVEVDYEHLSERMKEYILQSLRNGQVTSNLTVEELEGFRAAPPPPPSSPKDPPGPSMEEILQKKRLKALEERRKHLEQSKHVLLGNLPLIRATFKNELDMSLLKEVLRTERSGKKRQSVIKFLNKRIAELQDDKLNSLDTSDYITQKPKPEVFQGVKAPDFQVEESEKENITVLLGVSE